MQSAGIIKISPLSRPLDTVISRERARESPAEAVRKHVLTVYWILNSWRKALGQQIAGIRPERQTHLPVTKLVGLLMVALEYIGIIWIAHR